MHHLSSARRSRPRGGSLMDRDPRKLPRTPDCPECPHRLSSHNVNIGMPHPVLGPFMFCACRRSQRSLRAQVAINERAELPR